MSCSPSYNERRVSIFQPQIDFVVIENELEYGLRGEVEADMPTHPARILCIGKDSGLLRSRCDVLRHAGYNAEGVMFSEADSLLRAGQFDLIILSAILQDEEKDHISAQVDGAIPILKLKKLVFASELLAQVEQGLLTSKQDSVA